MSKVYDNWERLVEATLNREKLRELAFCESFNTSVSTDFSSRFSFDSLDVVNEASTISFETISPDASSSRSIPPLTLRPIKLEEIRRATMNFHNALLVGEGRFGSVFKGWIDEYSLNAAMPGFGTAVAVKKWSPDFYQGYNEWLAEVNYLSQLHHPNLVKLIGHCSEEDNLILVYELMTGGFLGNRLFNRGCTPLSWATRIKVAIGTARALSLLHDREKQIIHRDVHSRNIFLDEDFNAKLSYFGLAMDGPSGGMSYVSTRVIGRHGYVAPEYAYTGHLTAKCDVYGFGVVLLELLSGRRVIDKTKVAMEQNLVDWAKACIPGKKKLFRIMDTKLEGQYPQKEVDRVAALALKCLKEYPHQRPKMSEVLVELEKL